MASRTRSPAATLRCVVYARVSSDRQDVENSLDRQLRACREWAERNGHVLLEDLAFIDEARSGASTLARPAFQRLLGALRTRLPLPFDAVLLDDDSRLDRGGKMAGIVEAFQVRGVRLITVDSGRDLTEESERLLVHVKSGLNEHYLHELARRTRNGLASKVLHGFHAGGRTYGYRLVPVWPEGVAPERRDRGNRVGTLVEVCEDQARVVRRIFEQYANGSGHRGDRPHAESRRYPLLAWARLLGPVRRPRHAPQPTLRGRLVLEPLPLAEDPRSPPLRSRARPHPAHGTSPTTSYAACGGRAGRVPARGPPDRSSGSMGRRPGAVQDPAAHGEGRTRLQANALPGRWPSHLHVRRQHRDAHERAEGTPVHPTLLCAAP